MLPVYWMTDCLRCYRNEVHFPRGARALRFMSQHESTANWGIRLDCVVLMKCIVASSMLGYFVCVCVCTGLSLFKEKGGGIDFVCVCVCVCACVCVRLNGKKQPHRYSQVSAFFLFPPPYCCRFPHSKRNFKFLYKGALTHTERHLADPTANAETPQAAFWDARSAFVLLWVDVFTFVIRVFIKCLLALKPVFMLLLCWETWMIRCLESKIAFHQHYLFVTEAAT